MAMLSYPEVLMKAQKEIDSVIGTDRLPTMADRDSLPYSKRRYDTLRLYHINIDATVSSSSHKRISPLGRPRSLE